MKFAKSSKENVLEMNLSKMNQTRNNKRPIHNDSVELDADNFEESCLTELSKKMPPSRYLSFKNSENNVCYLSKQKSSDSSHRSKITQSSFTDTMLAHQNKIIRTSQKSRKGKVTNHLMKTNSELTDTKNLFKENLPQCLSFQERTNKCTKLKTKMKYKDVYSLRDEIEAPPNMDIASLEATTDINSKRLSSNTVYDYQLSMSDKHKFMSENNPEPEWDKKRCSLFIPNTKTYVLSKSPVDDQSRNSMPQNKNMYTKKKSRKMTSSFKKSTPNTKKKRKADKKGRLGEDYSSMGSFYTPRINRNKSNASVCIPTFKKSAIKLTERKSMFQDQYKYKSKKYKQKEKLQQDHRMFQKKLNRRKSEIGCSSSTTLLKSTKGATKPLFKLFGGETLNQTVKKDNKIQSLKQSLKKRVMEYKTMHSICINQKDTGDKINLNKSMRPGRIIPISKAVTNCPNSKLLCKCTKFSDLEAPYIYCTKSYVWLANAFCHSTPGSFSISNNRELQKLIKAYNKCSNMEIEKATEDQIRKDIVRTFSNNSGCHSMYKVLSAYSNLTKMQNDRLKKKESEPVLAAYESELRQCEETPRFISRSDIFNNNESSAHTEVQESFCEISFEDNTQYVQGMNFIVGILCHHLSPELAFCLFVKLMKDYDLEDNYTPGLCGFTKKSETLTNLIKIYLPDLYDFFERKSIFLEMFTVELIMGLCGSILPFDNLVRFYDYFLSYKWDYFYGFIIMFLKEIQGVLMSKEDPAEIIQILKEYTFNKTYKQGPNNREPYQDGKMSLSWSLILSNALDWVRDYKVSR
ncbi:unnamed protein product [Moneuplotes crassus]|uniref:Rab-GAP TBC domain-containing protein n=1 Tax=Euplotes crassus TaxID=5936 RepID=A0AAD1Y1T3_EUPCR|nr:unnamed protein product [Moneuplotes crassus]